MTDLLKLTSLCQNLECEYILNALMKDYTTFQIGGPCDILVRPYDEGQVAALIQFCAVNGIRWQVIGNGSNLLAPDGGVSGVVIQIGSNFSYIRKSLKEGEIICAAGASLSAAAAFAQKEGLTGLEFAWGIPGNVGGALFMNAGAYGGEMKDIVVSADYVDRMGNARTIGFSEMQFGYRHSVFSDKDWCITKVKMQLRPGDPAEIRRTMEDLMERRKSKQPLEYPSAGSVFKRPEGNYAGALIEQCGLKGRRVGGAQVSEKHAGFIVNLGDASSRDVARLIREIQNTVEEQTGYRLECELRQL
ncbi:MAG: UDP-N-acetylmuramate dehydrogenase [Oscillospiraceae bacterium]|jgi:UDP-N-acetylmuramate dehydrogenase|nr:UDP-N-acetylmuramate dehydrogenase [Oscillospiraceae bacterium]MDD7042104.1 UDP-N-acetylmuramate dehydrogenase [Oscillospiraceae bacterium]MDY2610815.1 UDP-N-acetylmuramate dehydrogenase [Oscillospiraceae bacterium]